MKEYYVAMVKQGGIMVRVPTKKRFDEAKPKDLTASEFIDSLLEVYSKKDVVINKEIIVRRNDK